MENEVEFEFKGKPILTDIISFMDGGSVILQLKDSESLVKIEIRFMQAMILEKNPYSNYCSGSLILDNKEVPIRSSLEKAILSTLKTIDLGFRTNLEKSIINEKIAFVESDDYLVTAKKVGRIN